MVHVVANRLLRCHANHFLKFPLPWLFLDCTVLVHPINLWQFPFCQFAPTLQLHKTQPLLGKKKQGLCAARMDAVILLQRGFLDKSQQAVMPRGGKKWFIAEMDLWQKRMRVWQRHVKDDRHMEGLRRTRQSWAYQKRDNIIDSNFQYGEIEPFFGFLQNCQQKKPHETLMHVASTVTNQEHLKNDVTRTRNSCF